ncbi:MAG: ABC transporter permease [Burkholderiales bacterium]|nr:ABC transporter permease [Burkholderiales bacterium]
MISNGIPTFCLGIIGLLICLLACYFVFDVPVRGSLFLIFLSSSLYLFIALCLGLTVSAVVKSQFLASQLVLVFSFLPTLILTDYLFDLKSAPFWAKVISVLCPATWYVELLIALLLVGNVQSLITKDLIALTLFAIVMGFLATRYIKKTLE